MRFRMMWRIRGESVYCNPGPWVMTDREKLEDIAAQLNDRYPEMEHWVEEEKANGMATD